MGFFFFKLLFKSLEKKFHPIHVLASLDLVGAGVVSSQQFSVVF